MATEFGASIKVVLDTSKAKADLSALETRLQGLPSVSAMPSPSVHRDVAKEEDELLGEMKEVRSILSKMRYPISTAKSFLAGKFPKTALAIGAVGVALETAEFLGTAIGQASGEAIRETGSILESFGQTNFINKQMADMFKMFTFWLSGQVEAKMKALSNEISDLRTWATSLFPTFSQAKTMAETGLVLGQDFQSILGAMDVFSPLWKVGKATARLEAQTAKFTPEGYMDALKKALTNAGFWK